jgi:hypothetical protein
MTLPPVGSAYPGDTPGWALTNGYASDLVANVMLPESTARLSLAATISSVIQVIADVERPNGLIGPTSIWACSLLESGDRKSSLDSIVGEPIRRCEKEQKDIAAAAEKRIKAENMITRAKISGLLKTIQNSATYSAGSPEIDCEIADLLESQVIENLELQIEKNKPKRKPFGLSMENFTTEAFLDSIKDSYISKYVHSSEALTIFATRLNQVQGYLNAIYSGDDVTVHRKCGDSYTSSSSRVAFNGMLQPGPFITIVKDKKKGKGFRESGFTGRMLFDYPQSMRGSRIDQTGVPIWTYRDKYNTRMRDVLEEAIDYHNHPEWPRKVLRFTKEGADYWLRIYNAIEIEMGPFGRFARCSDHASKLAEIIARMAAVFHYFEGLEGDISATSLDYAMKICMYHSDVYLRLFDPPSEEYVDALELNEWFNTFWRSKNIRFVQKNVIRQYCPNRLREKNKLNHALFNLAQHQCINLFMWGNIHYVDLNPTAYVDNNILNYTLGLPKK